MVTLKEIEKYHRNKQKINKIILSKTDKHETIHGSKALNKQVPYFLRKTTTDYDIFSKTPEKDVREVEKALDDSFGGNYFKVKAGKHKGTWKLKSRITGQTRADYTKPEKKLSRKKINGKNYVTLDYIEKHTKETLDNRTAEHRRDKDLDTLRRIMVANRLNKLKRNKK